MKNQRGQLLIESLVAITVIAIAILGVFTLVSRSLSLNRVVNDQYVGTYLAAEGIEVVKNIVDSNIIKHCRAWNYDPSNRLTTPGDYSVNYDSTQLLQANSNPLNYDSSTGFYSHKAGGEKTRFIRTISVNPIDSSHIQISSKVEWETRGGADFEVDLEDHFYDWRPPGGNCF